MRLRTERLELAFQFVFLLDSSGPSAVREAQEILASHVDTQRARVNTLLESWCSAVSGQPDGVHGDAARSVADLRPRLTESLYSMVSGFLQFEADRLPQKDQKDPPHGVDISDWSVDVRSAFARCVRDNLTVTGGREAMGGIFDAASEVFDHADQVIAQAVEMAQEAMHRASETDRITTQLAPTWPPHRQAATDRAILRLGRSEMLGGRTPPKWVVHHCVNLAKRYSTEKSPAFVNALLDKILKQVQSQQSAKPPVQEPEPHPEPDTEPSADAEGSTSTSRDDDPI